MRSASLLVVALLLALCLHFGDASWGDHFLADTSGDGRLYHLSVLYERWAEHLSEGFFPAWMPEVGGGYPAPATWTYGLCYPGQALFLLLPPEQAWTWTGILHAVFGALGMYLLARAHGSERPGALAAGLVFGISEFVVGHLTSGELHLVLPLTWAPWVAWQALRVARAAPGAIGGLTLTSALGLLAGDVEVWLYVAPVVVALIAVESRRAGRPGVPRRTLRVAALLLGLVAVQWLPAAELLRVSGATSVSTDTLRAGSLTVAGAAGRVLPGALGFDASSAWWGERWLGPAHEHEFVAVGGAWLPLLAVLAFRRTDALRVFWAVVALAGLLLATGPLTAAGAWVHALPPLAYVEVPARALVLVTLALPLLAGLGIDAWLAPERPHDEDDEPERRAPRMDPRRARLLLLSGAVLLALLLAVAALLGLNATVESLGGAAEAARGDALWPATTAALVGTALVTASLVFALGHRHLVWLPVAALAVSAWFGAVPPVATVPADFYYADWSALVTPDARVHRVHLRDNRFPFVERAGVRTTRSISRADTQWYRAVFGSDPTPGSTYWADIALWTEPSWEGALHAPPRGLSDPALVRAGGLMAVGAGRLFEPQVEPQDLREEDVVARVRAGDERLHVVVPGRAGVEVLEPLAGGRVARQETPNPSVVSYDVGAPANAWAFFSEKYYPGWEAYVDGRRVALRRANSAFRAVQVPAGLHVVTMRYSPVSLRVGAWVTFATLIVVAGHLWLALRREDEQ